MIDRTRLSPGERLALAIITILSVVMIVVRM